MRPRPARAPADDAPAGWTAWPAASPLMSTWGRARRTRPAVAETAGRVPRQRVPGRAGDRVRDRGPAAVTRPGRPGTGGERGGDRGRAVRDHLDVRPGLRRSLQPGGVLRRR